MILSSFSTSAEASFHLSLAISIPGFSFVSELKYFKQKYFFVRPIRP